ncbi:MAG: ferritin-like domain-containing protein [Gaiellaceae bacterium]
MDGSAAQDRSERRGFLKLAAAGAAVGGTALFGAESGRAASGPSAAQDREIFAFALSLEYLKAAFYDEAIAHNRLRGELRRFANVAGAHEREHVRVLKRALGRHARPQPSFRFGAATRDPDTFAARAIALEELAVAAYNGQAANLTKSGVAAALRIVSVEGRHAAWIRAIAGRPPAPRAADPGEGAAAVGATLKRIHLR